MQTPIEWMANQFERNEAMSVRWHRVGQRASGSRRKCRDSSTLSLFPWLDGPECVEVEPDPLPVEPPNACAWMISQLSTKTMDKKKFNNPRPPGVLRPGSGSDVLLRYFRSNPTRWFFHAELVLTLGRSKGEVDWALVFLTRLGLIEATQTALPGKKPVMRYALTEYCRMQTP